MDGSERNLDGPMKTQFEKAYMDLGGLGERVLGKDLCRNSTVEISRHF